LPADERKVTTQFEQEILQMLEQRLLQIRLGVFVLQIEEFEDEGILHLLLGTDRSSGRGFAPFVSVADLSRDNAVRS
jgi:hypothetical protein